MGGEREEKEHGKGTAERDRLRGEFGFTAGPDCLRRAHIFPFVSEMNHRSDRRELRWTCLCESARAGLGDGCLHGRGGASGSSAPLPFIFAEVHSA